MPFSKQSASSLAASFAIAIIAFSLLVTPCLAYAADEAAPAFAEQQDNGTSISESSVSTEDRSDDVLGDKDITPQTEPANIQAEADVPLITVDRPDTSASLTGNTADGENPSPDFGASDALSEEDHEQPSSEPVATAYTLATADTEDAMPNNGVDITSTATATQAAKAPAGKGDLVAGTYFIISALSSTQVLDVYGASKQNLGNVIAWRGSGNANQQWRVTIDKSGYAILTSVNSGLALDVEGARAKSGANVIQYRANNGKNQKWIIQKYGNAYVLISALNNNLVLDLTGNKASNGTNAEIWTRNNGKNQQFYFMAVTPVQATPGTRVLADGVYNIQAASAKSTVVDIEGGSTRNGANALTWAASGSAWQAWYLTYDNAGYYTITSVNSGRKLAPAAAYGLNGINVAQYSMGSVDRAKWKIVSAGNGQYTLTNKATGTKLNVGSMGSNNSANVQMGSSAQKFALSAQEVVPTGAVIIEVAANTHLSLDVYNNSSSKNAAVGTWSENGGLNQRFLVAASGNGYTIRPFNSRMYLTVSSSGTLIQEPARPGLQNQIWNTVESQGLVTFVNATTGKALTISGNAAKASAKITTAAKASNTSAQKFYMRSVPAVSNGTYFIGLSSNQSMVLDVANAKRTNNANVELWQKNGGNNQKFTVTSLGKDLYRISNASTGRALDIANSSTKAGANVVMYKWTGASSQKWRIQLNDDFSLSITNSATGFSIDTTKSSTAKGANVIVSKKASDNKAQKYWISDAVRSSETVSLGVPCYNQNPELPTGCESVALANALRYWGFNVGKTTIADSYMPYGDGGVYDFIGNPYDYSGWIICAPGITNTANSYLSKAGSSIKARNVTGTSLGGLRSYLDKGEPVIVWTTIGMSDPGDVEWYSSGYPLRSNNHAVVLSGYNPFNGNYLVADSISGTVWRSGSRFEELYNLMGKQAVVLED